MIDYFPPEFLAKGLDKDLFPIGTGPLDCYETWHVAFGQTGKPLRFVQFAVVERYPTYANLWWRHIMFWYVLLP